ncbi:heavy metal-associated isoprenylated plant protein 16 [Daucus carota subsp. sativus]|uniref:heavy metal-associated isoprenylated plant protein 16 n=1 Tax=Daucus carota subsp. sativus TaxID=79200 RepID=UPI0007B1D9F0|nr:PREDICTED: uncharacterized protein LOC108222508 [Daucus carota subsp. sativus]
MLQRIIVKVAMKKDKDRSKAMKVVAGVTGVISVKIGGDDQNTLTVIGSEVDAVRLARSLMKKFGSASLVKVEQVVKVYRFDQEQYAASMIYEGQRADNYNNNYGQPSFYNTTPLPQYTPQYHYPYEKPNYDSGCSIM